MESQVNRRVSVNERALVKGEPGRNSGSFDRLSGVGTLTRRVQELHRCPNRLPGSTRAISHLSVVVLEDVVEPLLTSHLGEWWR